MLPKVVRLSAGAARDQGDVDAEFLARPCMQVVVEVAGGVGEGGEDQDLAVRLAVLVGGGLP